MRVCEARGSASAGASAGVSAGARVRVSAYASVVMVGSIGLR